MNKALLGILALFGIGAAAYIVTSNKPKEEEEEGEKEGLNVAPPPPPLPPVIVPPAAVVETIYNSEIGDGKTLVTNRAKQIFDSNGKTILSGIITAEIFNGTKYKNSMKQVFGQIFGSPLNVKIIPEIVNPLFDNQLRNYQQMGNIEVEQWQSGDSENTLTEAISQFKQAGTFAGVEFWPADIKKIVRTKMFGSQKKRDKNWSNNVQNYNADLKKVLKGIEDASRRFNTQLRNKAISDLKQAGYQIL